MNDQKFIALARKYVSLSNQADLAQIQTMFARDATYFSPYFGEYEGNQAILIMMRSFFERFRDAHWSVDEYRSIEENGVEFNFVMTGTHSTSGEFMKRYGSEKIFFNSDDLIQKIIVYKPEE